jgi:hypothetical protein
MTPVRIFTAAGLAAWNSWVVAGCPEPVPIDLLTDPAMSDPLEPSCTVEDQTFADRYAFGSYLQQRLRTAPVAAIRFNVGLWDWLSLFYIDQLAPVLGTGRRKKQEAVRLALQLSGRKWSRHLVRMSWMSVQEHGERARMMLSVPMDVHPDLLEQLAGAQETFGSPTVIAAAFALYWDPEAGRTRRGAQAKGQGTPRRLGKIMRQLRRTWDPNAMTASQLLSLLPPREFGRWTKEAAALPVFASADP